MDEILTMREIKERYDSEWVVIADPVTNKLLEVQGGAVLWHGPDHDKAYDKLEEFQPKSAAVLYIGDLPKEEVFWL